MADWRRWTVSGDEPSGEQEAGDQQPQKPAAPAETAPGADKERKIAELTDDLKRLQADFENFKKRTEREWTERGKYANQKFMADLLPVLDSFDKAMSEAKNAGDADCLREGLERVHRQLVQTLEKEGLREIRTDVRFDPFVHEALQREESPDADDGRILEVYQRGYTLNGKALRPAKVKVARRAEPEQPPEKGAAEGEDDDQYPVK